MKSVTNGRITLFLAIAFMSGSISAFGQARIAKATAKANAPSLALYPLEDLRPGMKGIARSVFAGSEAQEFGVEILGILPGFTGPRQATIIAKLSGANVDKATAIIGASSDGKTFYFENLENLKRFKTGAKAPTNRSSP